MVDGVPAHGVLGSAYSHGVLSGKSQLPVAVLGFKKILYSVSASLVGSGEEDSHQYDVVQINTRLSHGL